ncbi:ATP-binding protein [Desulfosoma sp.]|uniref:ATP-binding protein n=1 Tax=Desulfosoma sp. TaxID=2603217 RepID=UPI00404A2414
MIEDMVRLVERLSKGKDISFQRSYQDPIPPVWTDPPLLRQVLLNLLNNAVQAIKSQGTVTATTQEHPKGWVDISIADTGCGIPASHLPHLFDPFFTAKVPSQGTGLG